MKFCPVLPGSRQCYKLFINYILRLHVKCFILARRDPSIVLPGSRFAGTKFSHVIASARLSGMKISIEVHFNRSKIFLLRFYDAYGVICDKKVNKYLCRIFISQKQPPETFCKKSFVKNFARVAGKHLCWSLFAGLQVCNFFKKRLEH